MPSAALRDRAVLRVGGPEARTFLDRLVTCDLEQAAPGMARYGALLTPQGKIISDFIAFAAGDGFLLDLPSAGAAEFANRLALYRLRAKVTVADETDALAVQAGWGDDLAPPADAVAASTDPRLAALGWRAVRPREAEAAGTDEAAAAYGAAASYEAHRIGLGVPEAVRDFALGDAFPHEALLDQLAGVDFDKGCYVGQEVVSRMQHRGTARNRIVPLAYDAGAPEPGSEVVAGGRSLGRTGSAAGSRGLATLRLDRAGEAIAAGETILAGNVPARLVKPEWIRFPFPGEPAASAA